MEETKNKKQYEAPKAEATEEKEEKGFTAYLEIYGKSKMLVKVFDEFKGDPDELDEDDINSIVKYLENISGIDDMIISHSVLRIQPDEEENSEEEAED